LKSDSRLSVIVLTYNEQVNLPQALDSVCGWARQVIVLDSYSTDRTVQIAKDYGCEVHQRRFDNYASQRNYALSLPIKSEWVFFLDADEWVPQALKDEIDRTIAGNPRENGFYIKRRLIWMGRWIKRGYYPTWILRLFRNGKARCEERGVNEHIIVEGPVGYLTNDFIHEDRKGLTDWIQKHNRYATLEAEELLRKEKAASPQDAISPRFFGAQAERKRWLRHHVWEHLPPLVRPLLYFLWRYFLRGGFLDGKEALIYHFLQGFWFLFLIDAKYLEMKKHKGSSPDVHHRECGN
jgi:glycosyltransferase involved in cell wall biosynthesis